MPEEYKTRFYHYWHVVVWKGVGRKEERKIKREEEKEGEKEGEREREKKIECFRKEHYQQHGKCICHGLR